MLDPAKVEEVVFSAIGEYNEQAPAEQQLEPCRRTVLFGKQGALDSLGLVNLIVTVEQGLADAFDRELTIASAKAMSRQVSPFRTVGALTDYVVELLREC